MFELYILIIIFVLINNEYLTINLLIILTMSFIEKYHKLEQVHQLIKMKSTGTPDDFANKINKSRRALYNILGELKNMGAEITYNKRLETFGYKNNFDINLKIKGQNIWGGKKTQNFFYRMQKKCTLLSYPCNCKLTFDKKDKMLAKGLFYLKC